MSGYQSRRERQAKHAALLKNLSGPLRDYLPEQWIESAGGVAARVAAFPPSGHGLVHDSPSTLSRPVLQGCSHMATDSERERSPAAPLTRYKRVLQSSPEASKRIAPLSGEESGGQSNRTGRDGTVVAWQTGTGC